MFKRSLKLSRYLILGSSLVSCSGASQKTMPLPFKPTQKNALKFEMMRLWVKAEYTRLIGDELSAKAIERDLSILEGELLNLENEKTEGSVSSR